MFHFLIPATWILHAYCNFDNILINCSAPVQTEISQQPLDELPLSAVQTSTVSSGWVLITQVIFLIAPS